MAQSVGKAKVTEKNNFKQGRSGAKVKTISGPAIPVSNPNKTKNGGIFRPTKSGRSN